MTLEVLIDDVRCFRDGRPARIARSSAGGLALLRELTGQRIDVLWLDHDLGGDDTIMPVIDWLVHERPTVELVQLHTANVSALQGMKQPLLKAGYQVARSYDLAMWTW